MVEFYLSGTSNQPRIKLQQSANLNTIGALNGISNSIPNNYCITGRNVVISPTRGASRYLCRVWYAKEFPKLVMDQGSIDQVDTENNYIVVDEIKNTDKGLEAPLSVSSTYGKYVNITDRQTGVVKATLQIETMDSASGKITFKSTPTRSSVFNMPIVGAIPDTVQPDDLISSVYGSATPYFKRPVTNYLVQYAVVACARALRVENLSYEVSELKRLETTIEDVWKRRPQSHFKQSYGPVWKPNRIFNRLTY